MEMSKLDVECDGLLSDAHISNVCYVCYQMLRHDDNLSRCKGCDYKAHIKCLSVKLNCDEEYLNNNETRCDICHRKSDETIESFLNESKPSISVINLSFEGKKGFEGPVDERKCTDLVFLCFYFMFGLLTTMTLFLYFGGMQSFSLIEGGDTCGNVCGQHSAINFPDFPSRCKRETRQGPYVLFKDPAFSVFDLGNSRRECVSECPQNTVEIMKYCIHFGNDTVLYDQVIENSILVNDHNDSYQVADHTTYQYISRNSFADQIRALKTSSSESWKEVFIQVTSLSFGISLIFILIVSFATKFFVWTIIFFLYALLLIVTLLFCTFTINEVSRDDGDCDTCRTSSERVALSLISVLMIAATVTGCLKINPFTTRNGAFRRRIDMIAAFYNQAGNFIATVPAVIFLPIVTLIFVGETAVIWFRRTMIIETMGQEDEVGQVYISNAQRFARILSVVCGFWSIQFVINCQNMVIAGAVTQWYFARNKSELGWPVLASLYRLVRYHLGSVVLGSMITYPLACTFYVVKTISKCNKIKRADVNKCFFLLYMSLLKMMDSFQVAFEITSNQAYVQTAIYGGGFFQSYGRALKVQCNYLRTSVSVTTFGVTFVVVSKVIIAGTVVAIGIAANSYNAMDDSRVGDLYVMIVLAVAYFIAHISTSVFQGITEAIYMCFCEDAVNNDGTKPYFMDHQLQEYLEKSTDVGNSSANENKFNDRSLCSTLISQLVRYRPLDNTKPDKQPPLKF